MEVSTLNIMMPITIEEIKATCNFQPMDQHLYFSGQLLQDDRLIPSSLGTDSHSEIVFQLSRYIINFTTQEEECSHCSNITIAAGDGVMLSNCSHILCR